MPLFNLSKPVIIIAVGVAVLFGGLIAMLLFSQKPPAQPEPAVTTPAVPSSTPTANPNVDPRVPPNPSDEGEVSESFSQSPLLHQLPKFTPYWSLKIAGPPNQTPLKLAAEVYYASAKEDPKAAIEKQKPFILKFISSTGQALETYTIEYSSHLVQRD